LIMNNLNNYFMLVIMGICKLDPNPKLQIK
jgi:hypothetical protein